MQAPCVDDTTPPVVTITTPEPYRPFRVGMTINFSATVSESGVATIVGNLTNTSRMSQFVENSSTPEVGVYTLVVTATDKASSPPTLTKVQCLYSAIRTFMHTPAS